MYRALETERPDPLFRDPYARRLAGERGAAILRAVSRQQGADWAFATRTVLFDSFIRERVAAGCDLVVNLAAGMDARPYRLQLPARLRWVEIDLPPLVAYKERILSGEKPACALERIPLDLTDAERRRTLLARLGSESRQALVVTEGLIVYLTAEDVESLARDLAAAPGIRHWVLDILSPGLLRWLQRRVGDTLARAGAPLRFGPAEGPGFFAPHGWVAKEVRSAFKTAARLGRLSPVMRILALLPESRGRQGGRPWSGICLLERAS